MTSEQFPKYGEANIILRVCVYTLYCSQLPKCGRLCLWEGGGLCKNLKNEVDKSYKMGQAIRGVPSQSLQWKENSFEGDCSEEGFLSTSKS